MRLIEKETPLALKVQLFCFLPDIHKKLKECRFSSMGAMLLVKFSSFVVVSTEKSLVGSVLSD